MSATVKKKKVRRVVGGNPQVPEVCIVGIASSWLALACTKGKPVKGSILPLMPILTQYLDIYNGFTQSSGPYASTACRASSSINYCTILFDRFMCLSFSSISILSVARTTNRDTVRHIYGTALVAFTKTSNCFPSFDSHLQMPSTSSPGSSLFSQCIF